jgi:hypothetical protein
MFVMSQKALDSEVVKENYNIRSLTVLDMKGVKYSRQLREVY